MLNQFIAAMVGVWGFSVLFHAPKKYYLACSLNGGLCWLSYLLLIGCGIPSFGACILSSIILTLLSRSFAVYLGAPCTIFLVTGVFPLVPGAGIYYTAYYLISGDLSASGHQGTDTFLTAGSIALGILIGSTVPQAVFSHLAKLRPKT